MMMTMMMTSSMFCTFTPVNHMRRFAVSHIRQECFWEGFKDGKPCTSKCLVSWCIWVHFGSNSSIPETNATRWNSVWMQLHSILKLDQQKLAELTKSTAHENLTLTNRLMLVLMLIIMMRSTRTCPRKMTNQQLQEVVQLLGPSAELTDIWLAVWCSGNTLVSINTVALHRARLVLGWVTAFGQVNCLIT